MQSLIFSAVVRIVTVAMFTASLYVLVRGHNEPGGGFVGGLIAASGFAILALSEGVNVARRWLVFDPTVLLGAGLLCTLCSGLPGLIVDGAYLSHQWGSVAGVALATTFLFDLGVYVVVLGGVLALVIRFYRSH